MLGRRPREPTNEDEVQLHLTIYDEQFQLSCDKQASLIDSVQSWARQAIYRGEQNMIGADFNRSCRLMFDGTRVNRQKPAELEMEDGDVIDVMVEQQGFLPWISVYSLGQKSWKNFIVFLEDLKTPIGHFEIN